MMEPTQELIINTVSSFFEITHTEIHLTKMKFRFKDSDFKSKFVSLTQNLEKYNLVCVLEKSNNEIVLSAVSYTHLKLPTNREV